MSRGNLGTRGEASWADWSSQVPINYFIKVDNVLHCELSSLHFTFLALKNPKKI